MAKSMNIPQEIIDNVIAAVGDDKRLLKKCALVSSSFLLPSRKKLFSKITIGSGKHCKRIHQILVQNPAIQSFVRTISLTEDAMIESWGSETSKWMNGTSLLAILQLPFRSLECFLIVACRDEWVWSPWNWNRFSSEVKDALSNIIHSPTLKTLSLSGITEVPTTFFLHIVHLKTLELDSLSPNDFGGGNSSMLTQTMASHLVIDRCVWRFSKEHAQSHRTSESKFLPFMCRLRFLEMHIDLGSATIYDFQILSFLMASLRTSLTSPATLELLEFNIRFRGVDSDFNFHSFYDNLRVGEAWSHLDSIATHPAGSKLQRVGINIDYAFREEDDGAEPDKDEVLKALLDGLPLLRRKGILFVKAVVGYWVE